MHAAVAQPDSPKHASSRACRLNWFTPTRCRLILGGVILLGFVGHLIYLMGDCPIDLSGDEAQYWDWSRQLDLSYYSKGPLVALIIRASCAVFGDVMWAVRLPALILAAGTALLTYLLTRKLFSSDRLALGAVLLCGAVPMFIAGGVLMTIDPPFYFCWALATYLATHAVFDDRRWCWPIIGVVVGVGFLAKYAMLLWLPSIGLALWLDRNGARRQLRSAWPWLAVVVAMLFTTPVIVWNARHDWVSMRHVATQTGTDAVNRFDPLSFPAFLGGQIGVLGPPVAVLMVAGVVWALGHANRSRETTFLLAVGLPFFILTALTSLRTKAQPNWPAPAYFTLLILTAHFIANRMRDPARWKPWRRWVLATILLGVIATPLAHNTHWLYPLLKTPQRVRKFDPTVRLKGWAEQGAFVGAELRQLGPSAFVLCDDYQETAEMAFYVPGQPKTYCAGAYFTGERRKRHTQYDVWPDRSLDPARNTQLIGRDAIFLGFLKDNQDIRQAFGRVEGPFVKEVIEHGVVVRTIRYARCYGFKGMTIGGQGGSF